MQLIFKKLFKKSYQKLDSSIKLKVDNTLSTFLSNPLDISLNNHALQGDLIGKRSINVTGDYRIIFKLTNGKTYEIVEVIQVGTHSQLY